MFDNLNINTIPNNLCNNNIANIKSCKLPYEEYNDVGEFVGYSWSYEDTVTLEFDIAGELTVEGDAIIYTAKGSSPDISTIGTINQKAYNTTDLISWTCTSVENNSYTWTQDESWETPAEGINTYVTISEYLEGKYLYINIYNFRHEKEYSSNPIDAKEIIYFNITNNMIKTTPNMTEADYKPLDKGIHYLTLILKDENGEYIDTLIGQQNCPLIVK